MQGFQTSRIKGGRDSIVFLQLQTMNQHSAGSLLGKEEENLE